MSEVDYIYTEAPLREIIPAMSREEQIVVVRGPIETREFLSVSFPKETHYRKSDENKYQEFVTHYEVVGTIRAQTLKAGDSIWIWEKPAYSLKDITKYHEEGLSCSPVIYERKPDYPIDENQHIAFIHTLPSKTTANFPVVYECTAVEGTDAEKEIRKLLKKNSAPWHMFFSRR
jgi:hypothetical protein